MKILLKAVICLFSLFLSGCYLDINFVGEGQVVSTDGELSCDKSCRKTGEPLARYLNAIPAAGYRFLGFVSQNPEIRAGREQFYVEYGIGLVPHDMYPNRVTLRQRSTQVSAIFWPEDDVHDAVVTSGSICLVDQSAHLHCWGESANKFPADNLTGLAGNSDGNSFYSLCAIYADNVRCWNDFYKKDWIVPDSITRPIDAVISDNYLCVLHNTDAGNAVYCASEFGAQPEPVPALTNPTDLRAGGDGLICVEDQGESVCWGGEFHGQSKVPAGLGPVTAFATGDTHTCAVASGKVRCWGNNAQGQLNVPDDLIAPTAITAGSGHTCVQDSGEIRCWGSLQVRLSLVDPATFNPSHFDSRDELLCVAGVTQDESVLCQGANGQITSPPLTNTSAMAILYSYGSSSVEIATISDGRLHYWRSGGSESLVGPVLTNASLLAASEFGICAVDAAGLQCWLRPQWEEILEPYPNSKPIELGLLPVSLQWRAYHGCAVEDGQVQCWGANLDVPTNLPPMAQVDIGRLHACGLSQDQRLFCWGEKPLPIE